MVFDGIAAASVAAKIGTDQAAGGTYDLYTVDEPFLPQFVPFFLPLEAWPKRPLGGIEPVSVEGLVPAARRAAEYQGKLYGLPISGSVYTYVYRGDLWQDKKEQQAFHLRYGYPLAPATSLKTLRDTAEFFTRPPQLYGFAPFTRMSEGTTVEALWILGMFGTALLDEQQHLAFDEEKATAAFAAYQDLLRFAPPGARNWHHSERMGAYAKGRIAQILTWPNFLAGLEQPRTSLVVGRSQYGLTPTGADGKPVTIAGSWLVCVPKTSKRPELAVAFARWWGSLATGRELVLKGGMSPVRVELLQDRSLARSLPWMPAVAGNFAAARTRPRLPEYKQVSDILSRHFTSLIAGELTPRGAAQAVKSDLSTLLARRVSH